MKVTNVYTRNLEAYHKFKNTGTLIENRGGQGSSKTVSILQVIYTIASESKKPRTITISSYALPHLKAGAMQNFNKILFENGIDPQSIKKETVSKYYLNTSEIEFVGIEGNEARVTGPRRDILYINELNNRIKYDVFDLMNSRTHEITFIDYNPKCQFWLQKEFNPNFPYYEIVSTYLDNPYLPESERNKILMKKDKPSFDNWWKVYGEGQFGAYEDVILPNWRYGEFIEQSNLMYGLDFGVTHPDAMVKESEDKKNKKLYVHECFYKTGNSTDDLLQLINAHKKDKHIIAADNSSKRTILDLQKKGVNIKGFKKNPIKEDIKALLDYEIIISPTSYNLANELENWIWLDKDNEIPVDDFNHLIDPTRYAYNALNTTKLYKGQRLIKK